MTRLFPIGLSIGAFAIALLTAGTQPLFAAMSAAIALAVLVGRHFYHSVEVSAAWRGPDGHRLSPLRGQAPAGLASSSFNPSRKEV